MKQADQEPGKVKTQRSGTNKSNKNTRITVPSKSNKKTGFILNDKALTDIQASKEDISQGSFLTDSVFNKEVSLWLRSR